MDAVRDAWTDERLDDLANRVDRGFDRAHADVRELREDMDRSSRELREEMNTRFGAVDARLDGMQRTMILGFGTIVASVIASGILTNL
jgi:hypothetical protein